MNIKQLLLKWMKNNKDYGKQLTGTIMVIILKPSHSFVSIQSVVWNAFSVNYILGWTEKASHDNTTASLLILRCDRHDTDDNNYFYEEQGVVHDDHSSSAREFGHANVKFALPDDDYDGNDDSFNSINKGKASKIGPVIITAMKYYACIDTKDDIVMIIGQNNGQKNTGYEKVVSNDNFNDEIQVLDKIESYSMQGEKLCLGTIVARTSSFSDAAGRSKKKENNATRTNIVEAGLEETVYICSPWIRQRKYDNDRNDAGSTTDTRADIHLSLFLFEDTDIIERYKPQHGYPLLDEATVTEHQIVGLICQVDYLSIDECSDRVDSLRPSTNRNRKALLDFSDHHHHHHHCNGNEGTLPSFDRSILSENSPQQDLAEKMPLSFCSEEGCKSSERENNFHTYKQDLERNDMHNYKLRLDSKWSASSSVDCTDQDIAMQGFYQDMETPLIHPFRRGFRSNKCRTLEKVKEKRIYLQNAESSFRKMLLLIVAWLCVGYGSASMQPQQQPQQQHRVQDNSQHVTLSSSIKTTNSLISNSCSFQRVNDYSVYSCNSSGYLSFLNNVTVRMLVVGGGGAGGDSFSDCDEGGGGGGAGQYLEVFHVHFDAGVQYAVNIGWGGGTLFFSKYGFETTINTANGTYRAMGGGIGADGRQFGVGGASGGGGNGCDYDRHGGESYWNVGYSGGTGNRSGPGGGGGGAGGAGGSDGSGGIGRQWSINGVYYGGGGGGGYSYDGRYGLGGSNIGGDGGTAVCTSGSPAVPNTGSGGGGGGYCKGAAGTGVGGTGSAGVVVIAFIQCNAGYGLIHSTDSSCTQCIAGKYSSYGNNSCNSCLAGKYSSAGSESCTKCPAGTFSSTSGSVSCDSCDAGYSSSEGSVLCSFISHSPTAVQTSHPTLVPTMSPSSVPSIIPTALKTLHPSQEPTMSPSGSPSIIPTALPTLYPTQEPTMSPSGSPSISPTALPTMSPTLAPTISVLSCIPSFQPSQFPTSSVPSLSISSPGKNSTFYLRQPTVSPSSTPLSSYRAANNTENSSAISTSMLWVICIIGGVLVVSVPTAVYLYRTGKMDKFKVKWMGTSINSNIFKYSESNRQQFSAAIHPELSSVPEPDDNQVEVCTVTNFVPFDVRTKATATNDVLFGDQKIFTKKNSLPDSKAAELSQVDELPVEKVGFDDDASDFIMESFLSNQVVFVKKASLRALRDRCRQTLEPTEDIMILRVDDFKKCSFDEIKKFQYATINYVKGTLWTSLVEFIFGINGVQADFIFLDAFCINHCVKSGDQRKVMEWRSKIFEYSKEHHIIESTCLFYTEHWFDLSFIDRKLRPTFHNTADDPVADTKMLKLVEAKGFDCVDISEPGEATMKEFVKQSIVSRWGNMDNLNGRVRDIVVNAMELSEFYMDGNHGVMLLKTESLKNLYYQKDMSSEIILDEFWMGRGNIFSLIPKKEFVRCNWSTLPKMKYAVLSYQWRKHWHAILKFIFHPHHGVKVEYIWIDVFCLNQLDGNRMTTIRRSDEIYYNAYEYHLIELGSVFRGWILFELASAREGVLPVVHTSNKDKKKVIYLTNEFKENGFEGSEFSKPLDKELVRNKIVEKHNSVKEFNDKVVTIIDAIILKS